MNICVYGVGAVGGLLAARLVAFGQFVTVIARGNTARALATRGIGLETDGRREFYPVRVETDPAVPGPQDLVIIAVKQPDLNAIAERIGPLLGAGTRVLLAMNGVPWWFFDGLEGAPQNRVLQTIDPSGRMRTLIPTETVIGCVVHLACSIAEPGVSRLNVGNRLIIGEPAGAPSDGTRQVAHLLRQAGFELEVSERIQRDIWFKLWGNMTMNPVSALTRATTDRILGDPLVNQFCCRVMREAADVGSAIGCAVDQTPEERNEVTLKLGAMRTSMLQDVIGGRDLEYEALIGTVHEIARRVAIDTPNIDALYGLIRLLATSIGRNRRH